MIILIEEERTRLYYDKTDGTLDYFNFWFPSGYCQYYYKDGYFYEYSDGMNKSGSRTEYLSKTEYADEQAWAKFEELVGEKINLVN